MVYKRKAPTAATMSANRADVNNYPVTQFNTRTQQNMKLTRSESIFGIGVVAIGAIAFAIINIVLGVF